MRIFPRVKQVKGTLFDSFTDIQAFVTWLLHGLSVEMFQESYEDVIKCWNQCMNCPRGVFKGNHINVFENTYFFQIVYLH